MIFLRPWRMNWNRVFALVIRQYKLKPGQRRCRVGSRQITYFDGMKMINPLLVVRFGAKLLEEARKYWAYTFQSYFL